jgi:uncharacterized alpha-E superfamily protein
MLSRVAHSVYWMFRYLERAQNTARFIDSDLNYYLDNPSLTENVWHSLIAATGDKDTYEELYTTYSQENIIRFLMVDKGYINSVLSSLAAARENARTIREIISSEMWEAINTLYLDIKKYQGLEPRYLDPNHLCKIVLAGSYLITGLFYSTMNRAQAWHFGRMGMLLERADKTSRILDVKYFVLLPETKLVGTAYDNVQWAALLKSVSGLEMYRKAYRKITPQEVIEFLIFNRDFPRSIRFCITSCVESLVYLTYTPMDNPKTPGQRNFIRLKNELETGVVEDVIDYGMHEYIDSLQTKMNLLDSYLFKEFFDPQKHVQDPKESDSTSNTYLEKKGTTHGSNRQAQS